jgi:hypothetical protein
MRPCGIPDRPLIEARLDRRQLETRSWIMLDFVYLAVAIGFFLVMAAYARAVSKG